MKAKLLKISAILLLAAIVVYQGLLIFTHAYAGNCLDVSKVDTCISPCNGIINYCWSICSAWYWFAQLAALSLFVYAIYRVLIWLLKAGAPSRLVTYLMLFSLVTGCLYSGYAFWVHEKYLTKDRCVSS
ncbi:MAG: hypothetical protein KDD62_10090 [Bdellovibrionales bacterium]|nr:hypothetical protein [Bdellovibrionales bacterium]